MTDNTSTDHADLVGYGSRLIAGWERQWAEFEQDESLRVPPERSQEVLDALADRLQDNYPFFHPSYAGQMLKPPHPLAAAAYSMAQRINPNAHALDGGPATARLEHEVIAQLAAMLGYDPATTLGHLTSSGTIANLEALWIARELNPDKSIAFSSDAHYTHSRMCQVLGVEGITLAADVAGRIDLGELEKELGTGQIGTVVATAGTTSIGAVDPIAEIISLARRNDARVHVDAAYGGYFRVIAEPGESSTDLLLSTDVVRALRAISDADSVVMDPHKHGLQPYGCGSVLFRDASVGRFYAHDSPYTYFTSDERHLGEISLECSRAGAAAAALWATLQVFPLTADEGMGPILRKCRAAAKELARLVRESARLELVVEPELDIVCFYPLPFDGTPSASAISALTRQTFADLMNDSADPVYLATLQVTPSLLTGRDVIWDRDQLTAFRTVLMKPEHLAGVEALNRRLLKALEARRE